MKKETYINKEVTENLVNAIESFMEKNNLTKDKISVTVIDPMYKVIIRVPEGNVQMLRDAEKTIYHGTGFDVFEFQCITGKSGILSYDETLTIEYSDKCSE